MSEKSAEKRYQGTEGETSYPNPIDAFIDKNRWEKRRKNKKIEIGSRPPTQLSWIIWTPPTTHKDYKMSLFFYGLQSTHTHNIYIYIYI